MRGIAQSLRRGVSLSFTPDSITAGPFLAVHGVMKPAQLGSLNADLAPIEEDLAARIGTIFDRCPQLFGFTVQDSSSLPEELRAIALERELVVSDIGVYPYLNADQCEQIYNEIAVALLDFMFERPAAKDVLRGRTFVRTLH
jgi:hypothetical protein